MGEGVDEKVERIEGEGEEVGVVERRWGRLKKGGEDEEGSKGW